MNDREVRHGLYLVPERMDARASGINKQPENGEGLVEVLLRGPRFPAQTLGERIRRFRLEQGLYQVQLAELARVDEIETHRRRLESRLRAQARALGYALVPATQDGAVS